jgi:hypothetical protein
MEREVSDHVVFLPCPVFPPSLSSASRQGGEDDNHRRAPPHALAIRSHLQTQSKPRAITKPGRLDFHPHMEEKSNLRM